VVLAPDQENRDDPIGTGFSSPSIRAMEEMLEVVGQVFIMSLASSSTSN